MCSWRTVCRGLIPFIVATLALGCGAARSTEQQARRGYPISSRRPRNTTCQALQPPPAAGRIQIERAFADLDPTDLLTALVDFVPHPTQPQVFFAARQSGQVVQLNSAEFSNDAENSDSHENRTSAEVVLDLSDRLALPGDESGLLSIALAPNFQQSGALYAVYTAPDPDDKAGFVSRLSRFSLDGNGTEHFDASSEEVLLDIAQRHPIHTGNHIVFGKDGYLYYAVGDDRFPEENAQKLDNLLGKVLRIDVSSKLRDKATADPLYGIPEDNPFSGHPEYRAEIYAYGLRNPWRIALDQETGELIVGDVGNVRREELNRLRAGANYGWPLREGTLCYRRDPCAELDDLTDPWVELSHPLASAVVAGPRYTKDDVPGLRGRQLFADQVSGTLWSVDAKEENPSFRQELEGAFPVVNIAQSADGTVFVVRYETSGKDGGLYRLVPNQPAKASNFPARLSETGCVDPEDPQQPAAGLLLFTPQAALWSDGADKERYLALPDDGRIHVNADGDFTFPPGTVLVKHFRLRDRYHETRLLMRYGDDWFGYSYRWDDDQREAWLLESSVDVTLESGQQWHYPSRAECMRCHTTAAGHALGPEVVQLDHAAVSQPEPGASTQLQHLVEHDYFEPELQSLSDLPTGLPARKGLLDPFGDGSLPRRARAYLHSNCANCHRPGGPGRGELDLTLANKELVQDLCNTKARTERVSGMAGELNWDRQRLLVPGRKEDSILWMRMAELGYFRMPPLGSNLVDPMGLELIGEWIDAMTDCGP